MNRVIVDQKTNNTSNKKSLNSKVSDTHTRKGESKKITIIASNPRTKSHNSSHMQEDVNETQSVPYITFVNRDVSDMRDDHTLQSIDFINRITSKEQLLEDMLQRDEREKFAKNKRYADKLIIPGYEVRLTDGRLMEASRITNNMIASSAPTYGSIGAFWKMIREQNIKVVVMLTPWVESGISKADAYFNIMPGKSIKIFDAHLNAHYIISTEKNITPVLSELFDVKFEDYGIKVNHIKIQNIDTNAFRYIYHIHYTKWTDMAAPDLTSFFLLLTVYSHLMKFNHEDDRKNGETDSRTSSVIPSSSMQSLIHCSAGIGRTGTFIGLCLMIDEINTAISRDRYDASIDVTKIIVDMRKRRSGMIQTQKQLDFVHAFLKLYLSEILMKGNEFCINIDAKLFN